MALVIKPFLSDELHGLFATRSPGRPKSIGSLVLHLIKVEENRLFNFDLDILDITPLLDITPYVAKFDIRQDIKAGWFERNMHKHA